MSDLMRDAVIGMPYEMAMSGELSRRQFYDRAQQVLADLLASQEREAKALAREAILQSDFGRQIEMKKQLAASQLECERLKNALRNALEWNWLDDDAPVHLRDKYEALLVTSSTDALAAHDRVVETMITRRLADDLEREMQLYTGQDCADLLRRMAAEREPKP